jgi:hypothetical protein
MYFHFFKDCGLNSIAFEPLDLNPVKVTSQDLCLYILHALKMVAYFQCDLGNICKTYG